MTINDYFYTFLFWFNDHDYFDLNEDVKKAFPSDPGCRKVVDEILEKNGNLFLKDKNKIYLRTSLELSTIDLKISGAVAVQICSLINKFFYQSGVRVRPYDINESHISQLIGIVALSMQNQSTNQSGSDQIVVQE